MSVELYERYMEALRRGHVALSKGQLDAALAAYREAAGLADDRAMPYAGIGNVHLRQGHPKEALKAFELALARTPRDETALGGRAEALAKIGRRTEAAATLDILSEVQEVAGRLADACDTATRALELAEQKARRRHVQELTRRLRLSGPDQLAEIALGKALRLLEQAEPEPEQQSAAAKPRHAGASDRTAEPGEARTPGTRPGGAADAADVVAADAEVPAAEPLPVPVIPAREPGPLELMATAEAAVDSGKGAAGRAAYLRAATAFQADGLFAAALDACYLGLAVAPADPQLHLRLVELYLALEWDGLAADKLALLGRLSELDHHDRRTRARIVSLAADHFPDDPRLRSLST